MKVCKYCKIEKPLSEYYPRNLACKKCCNIRANEWNKANPEKVKEVRRKTKLKKKYGVSLEQYDKMLQEQEGVCAVCKE